MQAIVLNEKPVSGKERNQEIISLNMINPNQKAIISHIIGDQKIVQRLSDFGLTPKSEIKLIRKMANNGPLEIEIRRTTLALAKEIADTIFVIAKCEIDKHHGDE